MFQKPNNIRRHKLSQLLCKLREDELRQAHTISNNMLLERAEIYLAFELPHRAKSILESIVLNELNYDDIARYSLLMSDSISYIRAEGKTTCSLTMIVKDEEDNIINALSSVDTIMDEIVICDTGSTDKTMAIAKMFGVEIIERKWDDNFSNARNCAIDHATSSWILWLDADDRVDADSCIKLQSLWRNSEPHGGMMHIANIKNESSLISFMQCRIFPRYNSIRFSNRIHEQIMPSIATNGLSFKNYIDITIQHFGYENSEIERKKATRNLPLILCELSDHPQDPAMRISLGDCLMILDKKDAALSAYTKVVNINNIKYSNMDIYTQSHCNCAQILIKKKDTQKASVHLWQALYSDNSRIEAWYALGRIAMQNKEWNDARSYLVRSASITPKHRMTATDPLKIRIESIYYLAEVLIRQNYLQEADDLLISALKQYRNVPELFSQYGLLFLEKGMAKEAAACFTKALHISPNEKIACKGMAMIYTMLGDESSSKKYLNMCA